MTTCLESKVSEVVVNNRIVCLPRTMQAGISIHADSSALLIVRVCIARGLENIYFRKCSVGFFFTILILQILFI